MPKAFRRFLKKLLCELYNLGTLFITSFIFRELFEICEFIKAKSLKFLSLNGLFLGMGFEKRNENYPQLTDHYFTGEYPVKPIDELGDNKVTQLSLLSTASNN